EVDLWLRPLGEGVEQALLLTGTASARALRRSPVVREGDGWPVADLVRLGVAPERHRWLRRLDPRPPARRVGAAWRTGRLGRALPPRVAARTAGGPRGRAPGRGGRGGRRAGARAAARAAPRRGPGPAAPPPPPPAAPPGHPPRGAGRAARGSGRAGAGGGRGH